MDNIQDERQLQIQQALQKLNSSEVKYNRIVQLYSKLEAIVNKQVQLEPIEKSDGTSKLKSDSSHANSVCKTKQYSRYTSLLTVPSGDTSRGESKKLYQRDKDYDQLQKRIFQFHEDINNIEENLNSSSKNQQKRFLKFLHKTNSDTWKANTKSSTVSKLEQHLNCTY